MKKKYELLKEEPVRLVDGTRRYRIRALRDIGDDVKAGDLGGYIESEGNLSQEGNCWVYPDATVDGQAVVFDNAKVKGKSIIMRYARVYGNAVVDNSSIIDYATVCDNAIVEKSAVKSYARVYGNARVTSSSRITDCAQIAGVAKIYEEVVRGKAKRS